jgi:glycosyltransferase involved in cell wall biosynthesis
MPYFLEGLPITRSAALNICVIHNRYRQGGGEDHVFSAEVALLKAHNHRVITYVVDNAELDEKRSLRLAASTVWNRDSFKTLFRLLKSNHSDLAHFHNTLPIISPSSYYAARAAGTAVVQTLHNYRLVCPAATLFRDGHPCEQCVGKRLPWPAIAHRCYRGSAGASATVAAMLALHRAIGTWSRAVDVYIALTDFAKAKLIAGGIPQQRVVVKPNFVDPDPGSGTGIGNYALFVGRLTPEKGVMVALGAWREYNPGVPLKIVGDGPLQSSVEAIAKSTMGVEWLGRLPREQVLELLRLATVLIVPSIWYEGFPVAIAEAYAVGVPVVASNQGSLPSIVKDGVLGRLFQAGDAQDLARQVARLCASPEHLTALRQRARVEYLQKYTADINYPKLMAIYDQALAERLHSLRTGRH